MTTTQTTSFSERIIVELQAIAERNRTGIFEACGDYCEENDLDESELISHLDKNAVEMLKQAAIDEGRVRKCVSGPKSNQLW